MHSSPDSNAGGDAPETALTDTTRQFFRGIAWVGTLRWAGQICSMASTFMVMRLLRPEDYGLFGMAYVFITFAEIFTISGIYLTVIAMPELDEEDEAQLHGASIFLGVGAFIIILAASYPISRYYQEPRVMPLIIALGFPLVLNAAASVPLARATKALDYKVMAIADLLRSLIPAVASLSLALLGAGVWSLVGAQIAAALAVTVFLRFRTEIAFSFPQPLRLKVALKYSAEIIVDYTITMIYMSVPSLVGGRLLGSAKLGEYIFAWTLAAMPGEKIVNVINSVVGPLLVRLRQDPGKFRVFLAQIIEGTALVTWPMFIGLILVAPLLVVPVFGEKWQGAVDTLKILAAYQVFRVMMSICHRVFLVSGQIRRHRQLSVLALIALPGMFYIGAYFWGAAGLAFAWWVAVPLFFVPALVFLKKIVGFGAVDFARALRGPALMNALMAGSVMASLLLLGLMNGSEMVRLVGAIGVGVIVYMTVLFSTKGTMMRRLLADARGTT